MKFSISTTTWRHQHLEFWVKYSSSKLMFKMFAIIPNTSELLEGLKVRVGNSMHRSSRSFSVYLTNSSFAARSIPFFTQNQHFPAVPAWSVVYCCIVLYLHIYIALLAVHTKQKHFQCEWPREKRAVLRERKETLGSPVNWGILSREEVGFKVHGQWLAFRFSAVNRLKAINQSLVVY